MNFMYGTYWVLAAHGQLLFAGRAHGFLDKKVAMVKRWRRRNEGSLGDLLEVWQVDGTHLTEEQLAAPVDSVVYVWFQKGSFLERVEVKL